MNKKEVIANCLIADWPEQAIMFMEEEGLKPTNKARLLKVVEEFFELPFINVGPNGNEKEVIDKTTDIINRISGLTTASKAFCATKD